MEKDFFVGPPGYFLISSQAPPCIQVTYDVAKFHSALFSEYAIPLPDTIKSSCKSRQADFLVGRYLARIALDELGCDETYVGIGDNGCPVWPENFTGSLSHADGIAVCIAQKNDHTASYIGIDCERKLSLDETGPVKEVAATRTDHLTCSAYPETSALFYSLMFSVKESFFKAAYPYVKRYFDFDAVSVFDIDPHNAYLQVNYDLHPRLMKGKTVTCSYRDMGDHVITHCLI
ncbi:hypothetical protein DU002_00490 [Corallincola holothuriorum]|uniref:Enterobactin synthase component D n=1 Tax=Corallincola holothuriorum TaxID=2282215 RepID=A0A368NRD6_9GAMM|nr:4'-phosphopantetheinyl transferase superfamily protein [Corallincola holothuriorum]RCU52483.1 hypothetical protein DU002_00490 [Corallincola holothuriorum]